MKTLDGCWTCRLRRKKCDEATPICGTCSALQIDCHYSEAKPVWMDGAQRQKDMAMKLKADIRDSAARRREVLASEAGAGKLDFTMVLEATPPSRGQMHSNRHREAAPSTTTSHDVPIQPSRGLLGSPGSDKIIGSHPKNAAATANHINNEYIMLYLDHFFPFLFPVYRPLLLEGGRGWVLQLIAENHALYHTTLCLSACFLSVAMGAASVGHGTCELYALNELLNQASTSFESLQKELQDLHALSADDCLVRKACIMDSIVYLQRVETLISNSEHFLIHMNAAVELFKQIMNNDSAKAANRSHKFDAVLRRLTRPFWSTVTLGRPWSSDQAGFRFFSALLIVDDVVASTALNAAPRLREYHQDLLTIIDDTGPAINLEEFTGCQNWVMLQVAKVSALAAEKQIQKQAGTLDMMKLVDHAKGIRDVLVDVFTRLATTTSKPKELSILDAFASYNNSQVMSEDSTFVTRVWAHAALAYLSVVVSGWQPAHKDIRENVSRVLALLTQIRTPAMFRTMFWPFCLAGCLAEPWQREQVRDTVNRLYPQKLFGTVRKALEMMEAVWQNDAKADLESRDVAACFRSLGQPLIPI